MKFDMWGLINWGYLDIEEMNTSASQKCVQHSGSHVQYSLNICSEHQDQDKMIHIEMLFLLKSLLTVYNPGSLPTVFIYGFLSEKKLNLTVVVYYCELSYA